MATTTKAEREYKKHLELLSRQVYAFLAQLDVEMAQPSTFERGKRISTLANALDMANDSALRYGLGLSFEQIRRRKNGKTK